MPSYKLRRRITAHADVVWKIVSDLGGLAEVAPGITKVEILQGGQLGARRRVWDEHGRSWEEECIVWEDKSQYTMRVDPDHSTLPFTKMEATCSMREKATHVTIQLQYDYQVRFGFFGSLLDRWQVTPKLKRFCELLLDNWVRAIHTREWIYRVTVETILSKKGRNVISVTPDATVADVARTLREKRIGAVLVLKDDGSVAGVVSERDIVRGIADHGAEALQQPIADIMTKKVVVVEPDYDMVLVMAAMTDRRVRHLPVMDGDELVGIISIGDVVHHRMAELETQSTTLRDYIEGRRWRELYLQLGPAAYEQTSNHSSPVAGGARGS